MSSQLTVFWEHFKKKDFSCAQKQFDTLNEKDKQAVFEALFQRSEFHRKPLMLSVLRGTIHEDKTYDDFYQAWLPEKMSSTVNLHGHKFQQSFPTPVRVLNATNINNANDVVSIGLTWVSSKEEEQGFWAYLDKMVKGEDTMNESRHDKIEQVADRELLGLFRVETDDNLGTPF